MRPSVKRFGNISLPVLTCERNRKSLEQESTWSKTVKKEKKKKSVLAIDEQIFTPNNEKNISQKTVSSLVGVFVLE